MNISIRCLQLHCSTSQVVSVGNYRRRLRLLLTIIIQHATRRSNQNRIKGPPSIISNHPTLTRTSIQPRANLVRSITEGSSGIQPILLHMRHLGVRTTTSILGTNILSSSLQPKRASSIPISNIRCFRRRVSSLDDSLVVSSDLPHHTTSLQSFTP